MEKDTLLQKRTVLRFEGDRSFWVEDTLLQEAIYTLIVDGETITEFRCLPDNLVQLALGFCYGRGYLQDRGQAADIRVDPAAGEIHVRRRQIDGRSSLEGSFRGSARKETSGTGEHTLRPAQIYALWDEFNAACTLFRRTGAAHSCALADSQTVLIFMEDVARHNALDKVIGDMLNRGIDPVGKVLIFSGRLARDMVEKVVPLGVKILMAPGAPTEAAVCLAEQSDLTLAGFVRQDRMNVYTHWRRITS